MMNVILMQTRRRAQTASRLAYHANAFGGDIGAAMKQLADVMAENNATRELIAKQNRAASQSKFVTEIMGNA